MRRILIVAALALLPSLAIAQSQSPVTVNGKSVTLNADTGGSVSIAIGGVKQFSSDGSTVTAGGIVSYATPVATATVPTATTGNLIVVPTFAAGGNIRLPNCEAGRYITVVNTGSNAIRVWPSTGGVLDAQTTPAPLSLAGGSTGRFFCSSTTQAYSGLVAPLPTP